MAQVAQKPKHTLVYIRDSVHLDAKDVYDPVCSKHPLIVDVLGVCIVEGLITHRVLLLVEVTLFGGTF